MTFETRKMIYIIAGLAMLCFLAAGHGILTVWMRQVKVQQYEAETERIRTIDYICQDVEPSRDLAFVIDGETIKCSDVRIDFVPSREKVMML